MVFSPFLAGGLDKNQMAHQFWPVGRSLLPLMKSVVQELLLLFHRIQEESQGAQSFSTSSSLPKRRLFKHLGTVHLNYPSYMSRTKAAVDWLALASLGDPLFTLGHSGVRMPGQWQHLG